MANAPVIYSPGAGFLGGTPGLGLVTYATTTGFNFNNGAMVVADSGTVTVKAVTGSNGVIGIGSNGNAAVGFIAVSKGASGSITGDAEGDLCIVSSSKKILFTTGSVIEGSCTGGAWALGATGFAGTHTVNAGSATATGVFAVKGPAITTNNIGREISVHDGGTIRVVIGAFKSTANAKGCGYLGIENGNDTGTLYTWSNATAPYMGPATYIGLATAGVGIYSYNITAVSDCRAKENIRPLTSGLETLLKIDSSAFDYKEGYDKDLHNRAGFVAQQVREQFPEAVRDGGFTVEGEENILKLDDTALLSLAYKAIQELDTIVSSQQSLIAALEARLTALETK
jgi:hypothetical protein